MSKRQLVRLYLTVLGALCIVTMARGYYLRNFQQPTLLEAITTPVGLNHLIDNSLSDLEETKRMERTITQFMEQWEIEGASLAIMKDGKLLYSKGFGMADAQQQIPMEVSHIFRIASLSKLITATGIMKLREQGRLTLESRVFGPEGILNDSMFLNINDKRIQEITVEHLLRHQAGFSIRAGDPLFNLPTVARQLSVPAPLTLDNMVAHAAATRLRYQPGGSNIYSNLGYVVLSKVVEKVSGQPYESYIRDSILIPIGCEDMHIGYSDYEKRFSNEVRYYEPSDAETVPHYDGSGRMVHRSYGGTDLQVLSGAGGWVASPTELMKFITAIDPDDSRPDILSPKTIAYMTAADNNRKASKYPIGWARTTSSDDWTRTGTLAGSSAMLKRQSNGYTWVFVTNTSSWSGSKFPRKIDAMIRQGLSRVKSWPERDLFEVNNPQTAKK